MIPLLSGEYRVLCVSHDGFDETERTEFTTRLEETAKIEDCLEEAREDFAGIVGRLKK